MFLEMLNKLLGLRSVNNRQPNAFILIFCLKAFFPENQFGMDSVGEEAQEYPAGNCFGLIRAARIGGVVSRVQRAATSAVQRRISSMDARGASRWSLLGSYNRVSGLPGRALNMLCLIWRRAG